MVYIWLALFYYYPFSKKNFNRLLLVYHYQWYSVLYRVQVFYGQANKEGDEHPCRIKQKLCANGSVIAG